MTRYWIKFWSPGFRDWSVIENYAGYADLNEAYCVRAHRVDREPSYVFIVVEDRDAQPPDPL